MNKIAIKKSFNRAAALYHDHSFLQQSVAKKLISLIKKVNHQFESIIDLGCGTGLVTSELAAEFKYEYFHAIDIADQALIQARQTLFSLPIKIFEADFEQLNASNQLFNLVFANMSLHWSRDFYTALQSAASILKPNGCIAFSVPLPGTLTELEKICFLNL